MKPTRLISNIFSSGRCSNPFLRSASIAVGASLLAASSALAVTWSGPGTDWNTGANWGGGNVPVGASAQINIINPVATISANLVGSPSYIRIGDGVTSTGRVDHVAGIASPAVGQDVQIGRNGGNGTYNLANTAAAGGSLTGFGQGSGSLNVFHNLYVGGVTSGAASVGAINVNTTGSLAITSQLLIGNASSTGTMKIDSGTVTVGDSIDIGNGASCTGTLSMSGGSITKTGTTNVTIGGGASGGGIGTANLSGGAFTSAGVVRVGHGVSSNGTLNVNGGALTVSNDIWVGGSTGSTGKVDLSTGSISGTGWVVIGRKDVEVGVGGSGTVTMTGGNWSKTGDTNFIVGASGAGTMEISGGVVDIGPSTVADRGITWVGEQNNCTGVLTILDGAEFRSARFTMGVQAGSTGTLNLNGGTVKTSQFLGGGGTSVVNFNGSQIVATGNQNAFMSFLGTATIGDGGLRVDTAGFNLTTSQSISGTGGVVKTGAGTLSLAGFNDFTGTCEVAAGKLAVASDSSGLGNFTVANGAAMGVIQNQNLSLSLTDVTLGTSGATSLDFDLGEETGNPNIAALDVTGALTLHGAVTINIADANPEIGTFPLIKYVGPKLGAGSFSLVGLPLGVTAKIVDNGVGLVTLEYTSILLPKWTGSFDGKWDTTTENWEDVLSTLPTHYADPAPVVFDDSATGTTTITLNETVSPGSVLFDNGFTPYSLEGTGQIAGPTGLTKIGTGDLALNTANTYTGATVLAVGNTYLNKIANAGAASSIGAASVAASNLVLNGTALTYNGPAAITDRGFTIGATGTVITHENNLEFGGQVATTDGNLVKNGTGNLTLSYNGANVLGTVNQGINVQAGTLTLRSAGAQTNQVAGEMWVAYLPDSPADLVLDHTSLSMPSWLALGRGNGDAGVCHMSATGSTIQTTNFSTGYNNNLAANNSETFVTLHNTVWTNGGVTFLAESSGSQGEMTLTGTTQYNAASNFLLGIAANTKGTVTLSDNSIVNKTGGYTSIGINGDGIMTVQNNASFSSPGGDFNVSDIGVSTGILNLKDSASINVTNVFIGKGTGTKGTLNQSGGSFQSGSWISIGRFNSGTGTVNISAGTMTSAANTVVGEEGNGTLNVSGSAVVTSNGDALFIGYQNGSGTLNLNGGTVIAKRLAEGSSGSSTVSFNGGTLKAAPAANSAFMAGLDSASILAGGVTIDTSGQDLTISQSLGGVGGLIKSGAGKLSLAGSNSYKGATNVTLGTLSLATAFLDDNAAVSIAAGAVLNLPHGLMDHVGSLTIAGEPVGPGIYSATTNPGVITGNGSLEVAGVASPFDTWINSFAGIPADKKGRNSDPDNDGQANITEFALGGAPNSGSNNSRVFMTIADGSGDADTQKELLMTVAVLQGAPAFAGSPPSTTMSGVSYVIQGSETLTGFALGVTAVATVAPPAPYATPPAGYEYRTFSLNGSNGTPNKGFLRVKLNY